MALEVLLLEDDPSKKNRLLALLSREKSLFEHIDTALCAADAIRLMKQRRYDLLIADIIVPSELGGDKSEKNCIAMFEQLDEGFDDIFTPTYALPISAADGLSKESYDFFAGRPWGIMPYTDSNDECLESIRCVARFVLNDKHKEAEPPSCDIFILTALLEPEFQAIESLGFSWTPSEPLDGSQLIRFGKLHAGNSEYKIAAGFCSRMGPVAAAILTVKAILKLRPKLLLMAGICAGIPGKADIGDVISTDISWDWQSGKYIDKGGNEAFQIAPHQIGLDDQSRNQLLLLKRDVKFWESLAANAISVGAKLPKMVLGPMATGASVLADARVSDRIKENQHKNVAGLDMETYGVFAAANACDPSLKVMSLKAVCDLGDSKKNDQYQPYAANVSAAAILHFLTHYASPLLGQPS